MQLNGRQVEEILAALQDAFTRDSLRRMVRIELGQNLEEIAGGDSLADVIFNLVGWAARTDRVQALIQGAYRQNDTNFKLQHLVQAAAGWFSGVDAPPAGAAPALLAPLAPFAPTLNPFTDIGRINDPSRFFVRPRVVRELCEHLRNGNSISLVGEHEIGKSSLLWYMCQTQATWQAPRQVVFVNLQSIVNEQVFCAEVLRLLDRTAAKADLVSLMHAVAELKPILLLDEVGRLATRPFRTDLQDLLRGWIDNRWITLTVASHLPLEQIFPPTGSTSPLHNACMPYKLTPFNPDEARAFLRTRLDGTGITFAPDEIDHLFVQTAGCPGKLQRAAHTLFEMKRVVSNP